MLVSSWGPVKLEGNDYEQIAGQVAESIQQLASRQNNFEPKKTSF